MRRERSKRFKRRESALSYNVRPFSVNHGTPLGMCPIGAQAFFTEEVAQNELFQMRMLAFN
jgi:hypothetical protein